MAASEVLRYTAADSTEQAQEKSLAALVSMMRSGNPSPRELIVDMSSQLTSDDDRIRKRGCMLFAQVLAHAPELFAAKSDVATAVEFFSARLADRVSVRAALTGCLALLRRKDAAAAVAGNGDPPLESPGAVAMVRQMQEHIYVQAYGQPERMLAFEVLQTAVEAYGSELLAAGIDLASLSAAAAEGERDPRCLLCAFATIRATAMLYSQMLPPNAKPDRLPASGHPAGSSPIVPHVANEALDVLFEVLLWYFPISFTPPPVNKYNITRQTLVEALEQTFASTPAFLPHFMPVAFDKLVSDVRQAKLDALSAIAAVVEGCGAPALQPYLSSLWQGLRAQAVPRGPMEAVADADVDEIVEAALDCLRRCVSAVGRPLISLVAEDPFVEDMRSSLSSATLESFPRSYALVSATSRAVAAAAQGSSEALDVMARQVGSFTLTAAAPCSGSKATMERFSPLDPTVAVPHEALRALALSAADKLVRAGLHGAYAKADPTTAPHFRDFASRLIDLVLDSNRSEPDHDAHSFIVGDAEDTILHDAHPMHETDSHAEAAEQLRQALSAVMSSLAAFPARLSPLSKQQLAAIVGRLLLQLDLDGAYSREGELNQEASSAIQGLTSLAGSGHTQVLRDEAVFQLLDQWQSGWGQHRDSGPLLEQLAYSRPALDALAALCRASAGLRPAIVALLGRDLPALLYGGSHEDSLRAAAAALMLTALTDLVQSIGQNDLTEADGTCMVPMVVEILGTNVNDYLSDSCLTACVNFAAAATSRCQLDAAHRLWLLAYSSVAAAHEREAANNGAAVMLQQARIAAAVIAASPQEALLPSRNVADVAVAQGVFSEVSDALVGLALLQGGQGPEVHALAFAAASVLNKAAAGEQLDAAVQLVLDQHLRPAAAAGGGNATAAAVCAGHVARGLSMRRHVAAEQYLHLLVSMACDTDIAVASVAAEALGSAVDLNEPGAHPHPPAAHVVTKPLWQQRVFTQITEMQLKVLRERLREQRAAPLPLATSLAAVVAVIPPRVLSPDAPLLLTWLLQTLAQLHAAAARKEQGASPEAVTAAVVAIRVTILQHTAKAAVEEHCERLLSLLLHTVSFQGAAAARHAALECLAALALDLSPRVTAEQRLATMAAMRRALDDRKRAVRQAAIQCRTAWTA